MKEKNAKAAPAWNWEEQTPFTQESTAIVMNPMKIKSEAAQETPKFNDGHDSKFSLSVRPKMWMISQNLENKNVWSCVNFDEDTWPCMG